MTKTLIQIIFPSPKSEYFFSATLGIRIFFLEKNHNPPPFKLNGRSLTVRENVREAIQNGQYRDTNT